ncbi:MAG: hypothetical protein QM533_11580 [Cytophagales bacterium]|nr:hypothetical protein [Cytophagales bacterium]
MTTLFICEKPSQAGDIAVHVGARNRGRTAHTYALFVWLTHPAYPVGW